MKKWLLTLLLLISTNMMANNITIPVEKLIGQFNEKNDDDFIALDKTILPVNKKGMYLRKDVTDQLIKAYQDFKKVHPEIPFVVVSATRNYDYQNGIWQRKWRAQSVHQTDPQSVALQILRYSSMPGSSRHHWGTDVDITSVSSDYFQHNQQGIVLYQWLKKNMPTYGFCQAYNQERQGGYQTEEWHWSYHPVAVQYLQAYRKILATQPESILNRLDFVGHDKIDLLVLLKEYVLTVNDKCD